MKNKFHNSLQQYSIVIPVPIRILTTMSKTLEELFNTSLTYAFRKKATGIIKKYGKEQRHCRFTVLFDAPVEYPNLAEKILLLAIDWTMTKSKEEYERRYSDTLKKNIKKLREEYKELKFDKNLV